MSEELLPCPFCGLKPRRHKDPQAGSRWEYFCPNGHTGYIRMKEWNTRANAGDWKAIKRVIAGMKDVAEPDDHLLNNWIIVITNALPENQK